MHVPGRAAQAQQLLENLLFTSHTEYLDAVWFDGRGGERIPSGVRGHYLVNGTKPIAQEWRPLGGRYLNCCMSRTEDGSAGQKRPVRVDCCRSVWQPERQLLRAARPEFALLLSAKPPEVVVTRLVLLPAIVAGGGKRLWDTR